mmetsp:Transcript_8111/g.23274  ORF Transcript_8111/g.23274 Transcript_8111/m.23274 type:complete len:301 (-) Transcript_8111:111-1013(-)
MQLLALVGLRVQLSLEALRFRQHLSGEGGDLLLGLGTLLLLCRLKCRHLVLGAHKHGLVGLLYLIHRLLDAREEAVEVGGLLPQSAVLFIKEGLVQSLLQLPLQVGNLGLSLLVRVSFLTPLLNCRDELGELLLFSLQVGHHCLQLAQLVGAFLLNLLQPLLHLYRGRGRLTQLVHIRRVYVVQRYAHHLPKFLPQRAHLLLGFNPTANFAVVAAAAVPRRPLQPAARVGVGSLRRALGREARAGPYGVGGGAVSGLPPLVNVAVLPRLLRRKAVRRGDARHGSRACQSVERSRRLRRLD